MERDNMVYIEMFHYKHCTMHKSQNTDKQYSQKTTKWKNKNPNCSAKIHLTRNIDKSMIQSNVE